MLQFFTLKACKLSFRKCITHGPKIYEYQNLLFPIITLLISNCFKLSYFLPLFKGSAQQYRNSEIKNQNSEKKNSKIENHASMGAIENHYV